MVKSNIVYLVGYMKQQANCSYDTIIDEMNRYLQERGESPITRDSFEGKFRRVQNRHSRYSPWLVAALFHACTRNDMPPCSPLEAALFLLWTEAGMSAAAAISPLYEQSTYLSALWHCMQHTAEYKHIDWSQASVRSQIAARLPLFEAEADSSPAQAARIDIDLSETEPYQPHYAGLDQVDKLLAYGQINDALRMLQRLQQTDVQRIQDKIGIAHKLGRVAIMRGQFAQASDHLNSAYKLAQSSSPIDTPDILANLGANSYYEGELQHAMHYYERGLNEAETYSKAPVANFCRKGLGIIHAELGNYQQARTYYGQALTNAMHYQHARDIVFSRIHIGLMYYYENQPALAYQQFEQSRHYLTQHVDLPLRLQMQWYLQLLRLTAYDQGFKRSRAIEELNTIQYAAEVHHLTWYDVSVRLDLAKYHARQNIPHARDTLQDTLAICEQYNMNERFSVALFGLCALDLAVHTPQQVTSVTELARIVHRRLSAEQRIALMERATPAYLDRAEHFYQLGQQGAPWQIIDKLHLAQALKLLLPS